MRLTRRARVMFVATLTAVLAAGACTRGTPSASGTTAASTYQGPRTADGKPDLNGVWQALGTAHWDIESHAAQAGPVLELGAAFAVAGGVGVVDGEIPYQPWAAAKKKENFEKRLTLDPEVKCFMPGVPRATYMPYPFQILQGTNKIVLAYEFAETSRTIHMDTVGESPAETWMGWSKGRWEGDTLVVDVTSFNDQTWFDRAGNFHSEALRVVERYTRTGQDHLAYEATIDDPKVFTRPWTVRLPLYRRQEADLQLTEYKCVEFVEELMYGHLTKGAAR
jgi:hypothetical protein